MKGITSETLSLISRIYDASLSCKQWPEILEELTGHLKGAGSILFFDDSRHPELNTAVTAYSHFWTRDNKLEKHFDVLKEADPTARLLRDIPSCNIITTDSAPPSAGNFLQSMKNVGIGSAAAAKLNNNNGWFDYLTFQYDINHGPMREEEKQLMAIFLPHVAKAIEISRPMVLLEKRFRAVLDALDHFHVGVAVLADSGALVIANSAARQILELEDGLYLNSKAVLTATRKTDQATLQQAIQKATATAQADGISNGMLLSIPRRSGKDAFLIEVAPLTDRKQEFSHPFHGAIVFMVDPAEPGEVSTKGMQELYRMTEAEAAICRLMVEGHTNKDMADIRGISPETVKSHVKSALKKTGAMNRSALVRLALSINLPVDKPSDN